MKKTTTLFAAALSVLLGLGTAARAAQNQDDDHAVLNTGLSLSQAVSAAERHAGGSAIRAELENENGRVVYGVEVVGRDRLTDVKVDANSGRILSARADGVDAGGASAAGD